MKKAAASVIRVGIASARYSDFAVDGKIPARNDAIMLKATQVSSSC
jgi:hypothetical protein